MDEKKCDLFKERNQYMPPPPSSSSSSPRPWRQVGAVLAAVVAIYAVVEATWLLSMRSFYARAFAPLMRPPGAPLKVRSAAAVVLVYPLLLVAFSILVLLPLINEAKTPSLGRWALHGLLFGAVVYGVYNLTNMATLPGYSWTMVAVDTAWGAACFGGLAAAAAWLSTILSPPRQTPS